MKKRLVISILLGAFLGIFCIIGIGSRFGFVGKELFLLSAWYNRVLMGLAIGLASPLVLFKNSLTLNSLVRGLLLGFLVSLAWFVDTGWVDPLGFLAGLVYGVIIDVVATKFSSQ